MTVLNDLAVYLKATPFFDITSETIRNFAAAVVKNAASDKEKAIKLFYSVRDEIRYDPYNINLNPEDFRASSIVQRGYGYCVAKAIVLCSAARACGVPSRIAFADVKNHLTTPRLKELMKTDTFYFHGYSELFIEGKWVKVTPTFNISLCRRFGVAALDFDGRNDAIFHPFDDQGQRHMEYVKYHGSFADLPYGLIIEMFTRHYPAFINKETPLSGDFEQELPKEIKKGSGRSF